MKTHSNAFDPAATEFEDSQSGGIATLEPIAGGAADDNSEWSGPRCEKCDATLKSDMVTVCRHCGWYASLGTYVEVDHEYEVFGDHVNSNAAPEPPPSHLQVWLNLLPRWAWMMVGTTAAIVVVSVIVRLATPEGGSVRTVWSLTQLVGGLLTFVGCHIVNMLVVAGDDPDVGIADLLLKPLKLWMRTLVALPTRLWVANGALNGITAGMMSLVVISGLPYERLWDWGFKEPPKQNLMGAVMAQAAKVQDNGKKDLEGAIGDFAGQANVDASGGRRSRTRSRPRSPGRRPTA